MARSRWSWILVALVAAGCAGSGATREPASPAGASTPAARVLASSSPPAATSAATSPTAPSPASTAWQLVAIGDSIPFGGLDCGGCAAFPELFGAWVESTAGLPVDVQNLSSHDNLTAGGLRDRIKSDETMRAALREAEIITVTIGHNDTPWNAIDDSCDGANGFFDGNKDASWDILVGPCLQTEVDRFRANLDAVLAEVVALRGGQPTAIRLTTQYADIPGDPCCSPRASEVSTTVKDAFNAAASQVAALHDIPVIDVYHAFNGPDGSQDAADLLASDHTHPSAAGQRRIADLLEAAGLAPLQRP